MNLYGVIAVGVLNFVTRFKSILEKFMKQKNNSSREIENNAWILEKSWAITQWIPRRIYKITCQRNSLKKSWKKNAEYKLWAILGEQFF